MNFPPLMGSIVFGPLGPPPHFYPYVVPREPTWTIPAELIRPPAQAWECPRCHAINAPTSTQCECKP